MDVSVRRVTGDPSPGTTDGGKVDSVLLLATASPVGCVSVQHQ
jgi:hypothetical protein